MLVPYCVFLPCAWHHSGYDTFGTKHEDSLGHNSLVYGRGVPPSKRYKQVSLSSHSNDTCDSLHHRTHSGFLLFSILMLVSLSSWQDNGFYSLVLLAFSITYYLLIIGCANCYLNNTLLHFHSVFLGVGLSKSKFFHKYLAKFFSRPCCIKVPALMYYFI